jgi:hypothetical protein
MKTQLKNFAKRGYEDLTLSEANLIHFFRKYGSEFPLNVDGKKVWIHLDNHVEDLLLETDIGAENSITIKMSNDLVTK